VSEKTTAADQTESEEADGSPVDETPELRPSRQQERDRSPDVYSSGYDPFGETRVGIGSAGGEVTEAFCSALDLPVHQQQAAVTAMTTMDLDRFGRQKRLSKVALATIKVVVEWDRFNRIPEEALPDLDDDQLPKRMLDQDQFQTLLEEQEVSKSDLYSVSQLVKRELKKHDHFPL